MTCHRHLTPLALALLVALPGCAHRTRTSSIPEQISVARSPLAETRPPAETDAVAREIDEDLLRANEAAYREGLLGDVYFDFDQSSLRPDARQRLTKNAEFLRRRPEYVVRLEGHCDERGTNDYNLALGERRARAAHDYLVSLGVDPARLETLSYGEERPECSEAGEGCWSRNRRAHFVLVRRLARG
jgi:peptidoglycan-associated lipoprotein